MQLKKNIKFLNNKLKLNAIKNSIVSLVGSVVGQLCRLIFHFLLSNYLGVSAYGLFVLGQSILEILHQLSMMGLQHAIVRFGTLYKDNNNLEKLKGVINCSVRISTIFSVICSFILILFAEKIAIYIFSNNSMHKVIILFSIVLPFFTYFFIKSKISVIYYRVDIDIFIREIMHPLLILICCSLILLVNGTIAEVIMGFLFATIIVSLLSYYLITNAILPFDWRNLESKNDLKTLLSFALILMVTSFSQILITRIDKIMLGVFGISSDVGVYNVAALISMQTAIVLRAFNTMFAPYIVSCYENNEINKLEYMFKNITKWIFIITLPIVIVIMTMGNDLVSFFGIFESNATNVLIVLTLGQFINTSTGSVAFLLNMTGKQKIEFINSYLILFLNLILNILMIPLWGAIGAALATSISIIFVNFLRLIEVIIIYKMHPYKLSYIKPLLAGFLMIVIILVMSWLNFSLLLILLFSLLSYMFCVVVFGIDVDDKVVIGKIKHYLLDINITK